MSEETGPGARGWRGGRPGWIARLSQTGWSSCRTSHEASEPSRGFQTGSLWSVDEVDACDWASSRRRRTDPGEQSRTTSTRQPPAAADEPPVGRQDRAGERRRDQRLRDRGLVTGPGRSSEPLAPPSFWSWKQLVRMRPMADVAPSVSV